MSDHLYVYRVRFIDLYDGDTFEFEADLGFGISFNMPGNSNWRLRGYDTPELRGASDFEESKAREAKQFALDWFTEHDGDVLMRSHRYDQTDDLNRWLAEVWCDACDIVLGEALLAQDLATRWPTRWREVHDQ